MCMKNANQAAVLDVVAGNCPTTVRPLPGNRFAEQMVGELLELEGLSSILP